VLHANTMIKQLGSSTEEAIERLQNSLNEALPYALGIFEPSKYEAELIAEGIYEGEEKIKTQWLENIKKVLSQTQLVLPELNTITPKFGGRYGEHTEHLQPLLDEMAEVFKIDPTAEW